MARGVTGSTLFPRVRRQQLREAGSIPTSQPGHSGASSSDVVARLACHRRCAGSCVTLATTSVEWYHSVRRAGSTPAARPAPQSLPFPWRAERSVPRCSARFLRCSLGVLLFLALVGH